MLLGMMGANRQMFFLFQARKEKSQVSVCGCFLFALRSQIIFGMFNNMGYVVKQCCYYTKQYAT